MPSALLGSSMVLEAIQNETHLRSVGYTQEEINKMPKWKVELYARVSRRMGRW